MALLEEWILSEPIDSGLSGLLEGVLHRVLPDQIEHCVEIDGGRVR